MLCEVYSFVIGDVFNVAVLTCKRCTGETFKDKERPLCSVYYLLLAGTHYIYM